MLVNEKYRDSVFTLLFQDKENLIELYNAIEGTNYSLDTEIEINTLENALYLDRKNDISFLIDGRFVVLLEHQSTINENMPLRFLSYIARVYEKLIDNKSIYREKLLKIPTPEFYVLYNGKKEYPKKSILKLSDAFIENGSDLELDVKVLNINYGKSGDILEKSKTLKEYSYFVKQVNDGRDSGYTLEVSIRTAMNDCMQKGILKKFLKQNGTEVINMLYTEFNLEDALQVRKEEGKIEGKKELLLNMLKKMDVKTISDMTGISMEELRKLLKNEL